MPIPVLFAAALLRIATLMPALTEDVCAVGAARDLVAVSSYSDDIPCARGLPVVGNFSSIDVERIIALHANLVIGIPSQARLLQPLQQAGIRVVLLDEDSFGDIFSSVDRIGSLTGTSTQAASLIARLHRETRALQLRARAHGTNPRVFVALNVAPIVTAGPSSYISTLLSIAGAENAVTSLPAAYSTYSAEALLQLQPDAIISDPAVQLFTVMNEEPWRSLRAVQQHHVYIIPDASLLERPGPRYNQGLQWLITSLRAVKTR